MNELKIAASRDGHGSTGFDSRPVSRQDFERSVRSDPGDSAGNR